MLYKSADFSPGFSSYPAAVVNVNDEVIGQANDAFEYVDIWNKDMKNMKKGRLYPETDFEFRLVTSGTGCCSCRYFPSFVPGCGSGDGGEVVVAPHLDYHVATTGGPGAFDPPNLSTVLVLPPEWVGKRIMVFRNGLLFLDWARTTNGLSLTIPGDVFLSDGIVPEKITIVNY